MSDDRLIHALGQYVQGVMTDAGSNTPIVRHYLGTWASAESADSNLSQVILQGGTWCRNVPKMSHVTGLVAGQILKLESSPSIPLHIVGVLVGNVRVATASSDVDAPTAPTSLAVTSVTTSSVSLSWTASTDNVAVVAYDIFVDGGYRLSALGTTATVASLAADVAYEFTARARDAASNVSGSSNAVTGTTSADSAPPSGTAYTKQYAATWSRTFNNKGSNEYDSWYGSEAHQGQYSGSNEKSLIGFNLTAIAADLSGATPTGARIRLSYFHWWSNAGGTAVIGTHAYTSAPSSVSGQSPGRWTSAGWPRGSTRWVDIGSTVCSEFQAGTSKGIMLGPGSSSSVQYYGKAYGAGSGVYVPILELSYIL